MRVVLAMLARSDGEPFLDRALAVMTPSFDGVEVVYDEGRVITDFAAARNRLIKRCESLGYDWMVMLDADECMYPDDIARLRRLMEGPHDFIALPLISLVNDLQHWDPSTYPDYHGRVFRLGRGYRFRNRMHEMLYARFALVSVIESGTFARSDETPIYHYGKTKAPSEIVSKFSHYESIDAGSTPLHLLDAESDVLWPDAPEFRHPHPLDGSGRSSGDWARMSKALFAPREEALLLREHTDLLTELDAPAGPVLGVGLAAAPMARYLAQRGHETTVVDDDADAIRAAAALDPAGCVSYEVVAPAKVDVMKHDVRYSSVFSRALLQRFDDDTIRGLVSHQLRIAGKVVVSAPSDRNPLRGYVEGRYLTPGDWQGILAPLGVVRAGYYGDSLLPLRQATVAKLTGALHQDRLHVLAVIRGQDT